METPPHVPRRSLRVAAVPPARPVRAMSGPCSLAVEDDRARLDEARLGSQLLEQLVRDRAVEGQHHERLGAAAVARDGHVRDVDRGLAEDRSEPPDDARAVLVYDEE